jgi:hypothetical protein
VIGHTPLPRISQACKMVNTTGYLH